MMESKVCMKKETVYLIVGVCILAGLIIFVCVYNSTTETEKIKQDQISKLQDNNTSYQKLLVKMIYEKTYKRDPAVIGTSMHCYGNDCSIYNDVEFDGHIYTGYGTPFTMPTQSVLFDRIITTYGNNTLNLEICDLQNWCGVFSH